VAKTLPYSCRHQREMGSVEEKLVGSRYVVLRLLSWHLRGCMGEQIMQVGDAKDEIFAGAEERIVGLYFGDDRRVQETRCILEHEGQ
jgi:hypothetical protein